MVAAIRWVVGNGRLQRSATPKAWQTPRDGSTQVILSYCLNLEPCVCDNATPRRVIQMGDESISCGVWCLVWVRLRRAWVPGADREKIESSSNRGSGSGRQQSPSANRQDDQCRGPSCAVRVVCSNKRRIYTRAVYIYNTCILIPTQTLFGIFRTTHNHLSYRYSQ